MLDTSLFPDVDHDEQEKEMREHEVVAPNVNKKPKNSVANVNVDNGNNAKTGKIILTKSKLSKKVIGKNNKNVVVTKNIKNIDMVNSKRKAEINKKKERSRSKIVPIIQTRKIKQQSKE